MEENQRRNTNYEVIYSVVFHSMWRSKMAAWKRAGYCAYLQDACRQRRAPHVKLSRL